MTDGWIDILEEGQQERDGHIPQSCKDVQTLLDCFVAINYDTARYPIIANTKDVQASMNHLRFQIIDVIRNNPPLESVPRYLRDGRANYLWYSDFYDDVAKDVSIKYRQFTIPEIDITTANYTTELAKIDLPYFKDLVNLASLEKLCMNLEQYIPLTEPEKEIIIENTKPEIATESVKKQRLTGKRSYQPNITDKQFTFLPECVNAINLFRRPVTLGQMKKLLKGRLPEALQVTNQKSLTYFFDQLAEHKFIKDTWISTADKNKDFISFRQDEDDGHHIGTQKLSNCRRRNRKEYIEGLDAIDEMIELMLDSHE